MPYLLALTLLVSPLYVWRFSVSHVPLNFLLIWVSFLWLIFVICLWREQLGQKFVSHLKTIDSRLLLLIGLFFLGSCISLFTGGFTQAKLGQFVVLFAQPVSLFFLASFISREYPSTQAIFRRTVYFLVALVGALALIQYFSLTFLPQAYWGNALEPKRAVGFFGHPDMFGLFLAPLLAWLLSDILRQLDDWRKKNSLIAVGSWLLGCVGLLLSLSRGAWFGFGAALIVGVIAFGRKKYWFTAGIAIILAVGIIATVPNLRYRVILPFVGEKSSVARLSLWHTGVKMIRDNPVLGKGLTGFGSNWYQYNTDSNLEHYNFPHNIILNFWVDTGLLGMLSFLALLIYGLYYGLINRRQTYALGLALFLLALTVHGLIDTPYLKNDLAVVFWLIWGISGFRAQQTSKSL